MKQQLKSRILRFARRIGYDIIRYPPGDFTKSDIETIHSVESHTMTSPECRYALIRAVKYIIKNKIPGDLVECGVWRGGSIMIMAKTLLNLNQQNRHLYLFDTFEGMTKPKDIDVTYEGIRATEVFQTKAIRAYASLEEVKKAVYSTGYDKAMIHFIKGRVEDTIPRDAPDAISLLRLDTDWYESTHHELMHLFPRLSHRGVIILDDYGHWLGAKKAVDEYISKNNICLFLNRIDRLARISIKI